MSVLAFILISLCDGQGTGKMSIQNNDSISNCTEKYRDLQKYVLNNEDLMDNLTEVFFKTGKPPTEFVNITYRFKVLITNTTYYDNHDGKFELQCIDKQKKFISSSSGLYLLGPEPLFHQTLFAVSLLASDITIDLPCLCSHVSDDLLSRLTHFVSAAKVMACLTVNGKSLLQIKTYPAMQFDSRVIQYISPYFFEINVTDEGGYNTVFLLFTFITCFQVTIFIVFSYLVYYSNFISDCVTNYIESDKKEVDKRRMRMIALIFCTILLSSILFIIHVIASTKFIDYGNKVLYNSDVGGRNDHYLPIISTVLSFIPAVIMILVILQLRCRRLKSANTNDDSLHKSDDGSNRSKDKYKCNALDRSDDTSNRSYRRRQKFGVAKVGQISLSEFVDFAKLCSSTCPTLADILDKFAKFYAAKFIAMQFCQTLKPCQTFIVYGHL